MKLLPGENLIVGNADEGLCITTHRIRYIGRSWGSILTEEIFVEQVSFAGMQMSSFPLFLVLAIVSAIVGVIGVAEQHMEILAACAAGSLLLLLVYFLSRRQLLSFASSSGRIALRANSLNLEQINMYLDALALAKNQQTLRRTEPAAMMLAA